MYKVKKYGIAIGVMLISSLVVLFIVSSLVYIFKWQSDKAMIGIIVTYIIAGVTGGFMLGYLDKKREYDADWSSKKKRRIKQILQVGLLTVMYLLLQILFSLILFKNGLEFSKRTLLILFLELISVYMGRKLVK